MKKIKIDFDKDLNITELKEEINLFMFNSPLFNMDDMKTTNEICNILKDVKFEINLK